MSRNIFSFDHIVRDYQEFDNEQAYQEYIKKLISERNSKKTDPSVKKESANINFSDITKPEVKTLSNDFGVLEVSTAFQNSEDIFTRGMNTTMLKSSGYSLTAGYEWGDKASLFGLDLNINRLNPIISGSTYCLDTSKIKMVPVNLFDVESFYSRKIGESSDVKIKLGRFDSISLDNNLLIEKKTMIKVGGEYSLILLGDRKLGLYGKAGLNLDKIIGFGNVGTSSEIDLGINIETNDNKYKIYGGINSGASKNAIEKYEHRTILFGAVFQFK
jgi:hypothetical protein